MGFDHASSPRMRRTLGERERVDGIGAVRQASITSGARNQPAAARRHDGYRIGVHGSDDPAKRMHLYVHASELEATEGSDRRCQRKAGVLARQLIPGDGGPRAVHAPDLVPSRCPVEADHLSQQAECGGVAY
jgi:hypothetical protein